jgi:hypothetical protein
MASKRREQEFLQELREAVSEDPRVRQLDKTKQQIDKAIRILLDEGNPNKDIKKAIDMLQSILDEQPLDGDNQQ